MADRLDEIKERRGAVSQPAPWFRSRVGATGDATVRSVRGNRPIARVLIADHDMVDLEEHIDAWDETHAATQGDAEFIAQAPADVDWLASEVDRLRRSLKELEWDKHDATCPVCDAAQPRTAAEHAPDCWLAAELYRKES